MRKIRSSFKVPAITVTDPDEIFIISYKHNATDKNLVKPVNLDVPRRDSETGSTRSGADFEKAINETGYGKFNYLFLLLAFPAACVSTYNPNSLSFALPTVSCEFHLTAYDRGFLNSSAYAGMILSAFVWGSLSDNFGRKRILVFGYLGDFIFGVAVSLSQNFWSLFLLKFFGGIIICGPLSVLSSYLAELSNAEHRDSIILVVGLFQSIGSCFQPLLAWAIIPLSFKWTLMEGAMVFNSWRLFMLVCTLPALVAGVGYSFCEESPRFLLSKGRKEEALRIFKRIYSINTGLPEHTYSVKKLKSDLATFSKDQNISLWKKLTAIFRPPYIYKALLGFSIQFGCLMTMNTTKLWLPQLFFFIKQTEVSRDYNTCEILGSNQTTSGNCDHFTVDTSVYTDMMYVNLLQTFVIGVSTAIVGYIGKRNLLVALFLMQASVVCSVGWISPPFTQILLAAFVALSTNAAVGLISVVVQIFPTTMRTTAVSLTMSSGRVGVVIGNTSLPFFLSLSCAGTFMGISIISLFCGFVVFVLGSAAIKSKVQNPRQQGVQK